MAEPNMELDGHNEKAAVATYDLNIITANVVESAVTLRWGGPDSVDGTITSFQRLPTGDKWVEDFWYEVTAQTDYQMMDENTGPDEVSGSQCYHLFKLTADAAYASAPIITAYDDTSHGATPTDQCLAGSAGHGATFIKIVGATTSGQPAQYWGEASAAALQSLETALGVTLGVAAQGLNGDVAWMDCTTASINSTPQYFSLVSGYPDDGNLGSDVIDIVISVKYTYT